jgi:hypothetical protein
LAPPSPPAPFVSHKAAESGPKAKGSSSGGSSSSSAADGSGSGGDEGGGDPGSERFSSRLVEHVLQQAFELASLPPLTRYRRFKPAFSKCLDLTLSTS